MADMMPPVAYFTAEIGLWSELHTYSGGLGALAGDHVKSAADAELFGGMVCLSGWLRACTLNDGVPDTTPQ